MSASTTQPSCARIDVRGPLTWFRAATSEEPAAFVISLAGDADYGNLRDQSVDALVDPYRASGHRLLVVHLGAVTFLDSMGMSWLLRLRDAAQALGTTPTLRAAPPQLHRLLRASGIAGLFDFEHE